jgi:ArsR family transcriptional regulator, virulence genes transcriptional regulator
MILNVLRDGERSVTDVVSDLGIGQANVSQHLALLRQRGLVRSRRQGASIYYSLSTPKIMQACDLVRDLLLEQLERNQDLMHDIVE